MTKVGNLPIQDYQNSKIFPNTWLAIHSKMVTEIGAGDGCQILEKVSHVYNISRGCQVQPLNRLYRAQMAGRSFVNPRISKFDGNKWR